MNIKVTGNALSIFLAISFVICMIWGMIAPPSLHMHAAWEAWLPGFEFAKPASWILGLAGAYLYGWYIALIFVPLHNFFARRAV